MYPRFETLGIDPNDADYLWIGAVAIHNLNTHAAPLATARSQATVVALAPAARTGGRTYASGYVGVTRVKDRWVGTWGHRGAQQQGPRRPLNAEGEIQAARDRAAALGRDYLEVRNATN